MTAIGNSTRESERSSLVLVNGPDALTVQGMERIWNSLTGKDFTTDERALCQEKIFAAGFENGETSQGKP